MCWTELGKRCAKEFKSAAKTQVSCLQNQGDYHTMAIADHSSCFSALSLLWEMQGVAEGIGMIGMIGLTRGTQFSSESVIAESAHMAGPDIRHTAITTSPLVTTWPEAERKCLLLGGNLASVHSLPQYRFLQSLIQESRVQRTWIGAYDAMKEGLWLWSDGSRFNYQNWAPGQPSNYNHGFVKDITNGRGHCMEMNCGASHRQNDVPCWFKLPFVCSRKL
ncbi:hypothetical protein J4Q44_G00373960 [Coregonus suidteri]|uniref:C-type lectin domain-containing protein n=1 Tax=Coregonus suidteri TaxID=861788 RepID=A0AAN8KHP2_9TELE